MTSPNDLLTLHGISKTVYSLIYPETRMMIENLWNLGGRGELSEMYEEPETKKQDEMHKEFLNKWLSWVAPIVDFDPGVLAYSYPTNGSSEAIRDAIDEIAATGMGHRAIIVFDGEYEGYEAIAKARHILFIKIRREHWKEDLNALIDNEAIIPRSFFLSQPSAIDGNLWAEYDEFMSYTRDHFPHMRIYLDLCYVGAVAKDYKINATYSHIEKVFFSLSKIFGVYYHRVGGVFSRKEMPGLYGNMWFKNLFSLRLGVNLMETFGPYDLPRNYQHVQGTIVEDGMMEYLTNRIISIVRPSDVIILAHYYRPKNELEIETYLARGQSVRLCLTPAMAKYIHEHAPRKANKIQ
jgi:hypothetical protein